MNRILKMLDKAGFYIGFIAGKTVLVKVGWWLFGVGDWFFGLGMPWGVALFIAFVTTRPESQTTNFMVQNSSERVLH